MIKVVSTNDRRLRPEVSTKDKVIARISNAIKGLRDDQSIIVSMAEMKGMGYTGKTYGPLGAFRGDKQIMERLKSRKVGNNWVIEHR